MTEYLPMHKRNFQSTHILGFSSEEHFGGRQCNAFLWKERSWKERCEWLTSEKSKLEV